LAAAPDGESSATIAERVLAARSMARARQGCSNAELSGEALDAHCALDAPAGRFLHAASARLGWSARGYHRVLRVARTIADLGGHATLRDNHLAEAIQLRRVLAVA
jgi:magnesium chelatase family protein